MNLLGRAQRALVEAGAGIAEMHQALHAMKKTATEGQQPNDGSA